MIMQAKPNNQFQKDLAIRNLPRRAAGIAGNNDQPLTSQKGDNIMKSLAVILIATVLVSINVTPASASSETYNQQDKGKMHWLLPANDKLPLRNGAWQELNGTQAAIKTTGDLRYNTTTVR